MFILKPAVALTIALNLSPAAFASPRFLADGAGMQYQDVGLSARGMAVLFAKSKADRACGGVGRSRLVTEWAFSKLDKQWVKASAGFECE